MLVMNIISDKSKHRNEDRIRTVQLEKIFLTNHFKEITANKTIFRNAN